MKRFARSAALMLLLGLAARASGACVHVENDDLIEYSCEGGSTEDLRQLPNNAEKIRILNMPVGRLADSLFSRFSSLVVLTCSHCAITEIEDNAFRRLSNLQQLSLDNNRLREVKAAWFQGLVYLTYLDLNYNSIDSIEPGVFRHSPDLVDLRLSGNQLECLDIESMARLKDLKRIFLNENPRFSCPNAVKKFLGERNIDYEADPHWGSISQDRDSVGLPPQPPMIEEEPETTPRPTTPKPHYARGRWTVTESPVTAPTVPATLEATTPEPVTAPPPPPRRPYVPEMIQPSVPEQDFSFQGPYYAPKVTQQQLDSYRTPPTQPPPPPPQQQQNVTASSVQAKGAETTTECPNAASGPRDSLLLAGLALAAVLSARRWTLE